MRLPNLLPLLTRLPSLLPARFALSPEALKLFMVSLPMTIVIASLVVLYNDTTCESSLCRGDFPGFYAPAAIVLDGKYSELYSSTIQAEYQLRFWHSMEGQYLYFSYPPFVALLLAPLALLNPMVAKLLSTVLLLGLYIFSAVIFVRIYRRSEAKPEDWGTRGFGDQSTETSDIPAASRSASQPGIPGDCPKKHSIYKDAFFLAIMGLFFLPLVVSIGATQNSILSLFLLSVSALFQMNKRGAGIFLSGIFIGLLTYKPQFALFVFPVFWYQGGFLFFLGFLCSTFVFYLLGLVVFGWFWPILWLREVSAFGLQNLYVNDFNMTSFIALLSHLSRVWELSWIQTYFLSSTWLTVVLPCILFFLTTLFICKNSWSGPRSFPLCWFFLVATLPLFSPQTLFYDLSLGLPVLWALLLQGRLFWASILVLTQALPHWLRPPIGTGGSELTGAGEPLAHFPWFFFSALALSLSAGAILYFAHSEKNKLLAK